MEIDSPDFKPRYIGSPLSSPVSQKNWAQQIPEPVVFAYNNITAEANRFLNTPNYSVLEYMTILTAQDVDALKRSNVGSIEKFIHVIVFLLKLKNPDYNVSFHFGKNVYELSQVLKDKLSERKGTGASMVVFSFPDGSYTLELVYLSSDGNLQCHNTNVTNSPIASTLSCNDKFGKANYIGYIISQN